MSFTNYLFDWICLWKRIFQNGHPVWLLCNRKNKINIKLKLVFWTEVSFSYLTKVFLFSSSFSVKLAEREKKGFFSLFCGHFCLFKTRRKKFEVERKKIILSPLTFLNPCLFLFTFCRLSFPEESDWSVVQVMSTRLLTLTGRTLRGHLWSRSRSYLAPTSSCYAVKVLETNRVHLFQK